MVLIIWVAILKRGQPERGDPGQGGADVSSGSLGGRIPGGKNRKNKQTQANQRRAFSPEQKIKILREHLLDLRGVRAAPNHAHAVLPVAEDLLRDGRRPSPHRANSQSEQRIIKLEDKLSARMSHCRDLAEHIEKRGS